MADILQPVADHIWFYPPNPDPEVVQPGVGVIIAESATVLVDAGNSPRHARQIRATLRMMAAPPVRYVIYTHHHWDHTFGGQIWLDSLIIGHEQCRALLAERYGSQPWSQRYIQEQSYLHPARAAALRALGRAIDDWTAFRLVSPHITFTHDLTVSVDPVEISLRHVGGRHAEDSITVQVNDTTLFLGDCFYPPPAHVRQPGETTDYAMIEDLLRRPTEHFIDSHNGPRTRSDFSRLLENG